MAGIPIPGMLEEFSKSNSRDQDQWLAECRPATESMAGIPIPGEDRPILAVMRDRQPRAT
jgi:hypothetical protein